MADGRKYFIQIKADTNLEDVVKSLNKMTSGLKSSTKRIAGLTTGTIIMTKAMKEFSQTLITAYNASIQFNKGLANVATLLPQQTSRVLQLRDSLLSLSNETAKPLDDLTNGLYEVISAFEDSADTAERMAIVTKASMAGQATTIDALQLLSAVGKGFNDTSAEMLKYISDLSFETVRLGQTNFPQLAHAIQIVTANSTRMGVSMEEMFNVFATMTGVTGNADIVATQLRSALASLADPTDQMREALQHFGYSTGEAMVSTEGFGNAIKKLVEYAPQMGTTVEKLFQRVEAVNLVTALSTNSWDTYIRKLGSLNSASGATENALAEITSGINKQGFELEQLNNRYKIFLQNIGQGIQSKTGGIVSFLNDTMGLLIGANNALERFKTTTDDVITLSRDYSVIIKELEKATKDNNVELERSLKNQKALMEVEQNENLDKLSKDYDNFTKSIKKNQTAQDDQQAKIDGNIGLLASYADKIGLVRDEEGDWVDQLYTLANQYLDGVGEGFENAGEALEYFNLGFVKSKGLATNIIAVYDRYSMNLDELNKLQREGKKDTAEYDEKLIGLANAYNQGMLSAKDLKRIQPELRAELEETAKQIQEGKISPTGGTPQADTRTALTKEETIRILKIRVDVAGSSGDELEKLTANYVLSKQELLDEIEETEQQYASNEKIRDEIVGELQKKLASLTDEYHSQYQAQRDINAEKEKQKLLEEQQIEFEKQRYTENLKNQNELLKAEDEEERLRIQKVQAIKEISQDEQNDTKENRELIAEYYEYQIQKVKEKKQLEAEIQKQNVADMKLNLQNQLFQLTHEDEIERLKREQTQAIAEQTEQLKENGATEAEIKEQENLINSIYEERIDAVNKQREEEKQQQQERADAYTENLEDQLFQLTNEDEILALQREQKKALENLNQQEKTNAGDEELINQIYEERINKVKEQQALESREKEQEQMTTTWELRMDDESLSSYDKLILQTYIDLAKVGKEIDDATEKYGANSDVVKELEKKQSKLNETLKKSSKGYMDFQDIMKKSLEVTGYVKQGYDEIANIVNLSFKNMQIANDNEIKALEDKINRENGLLAQERDMIAGYDEEKKEKMDALKEAYDADTITQEEYYAQKKAIEEKHNEDIKKAQEARKKVEDEIAKKKRQQKEKEFAWEKGNAIVNAIINGATAIMKGFAEFGTIGGAINAGVQTALTATQVGIISAQQMPAYRDGSWEIPVDQVAQLHKGETVLPKKFADDFRNKAKSGGSGDTINISGNTFVGVEGIDQLLIEMEERKKVLKSRGMLD